MDAALGHFTLLEKIGEGGMGRVYKARDTRLERFVAIKLLPEARLGDPERRARFVQEARAASALNHPNIVTIHEIGEHDGQTFIVMELVDGKPLNELIPRKGMRLTDALRVAVQAADALAAAHAAGIVHRDLKPANIMVDPHGRVKVLDFGLAKLTAAAATVGVEEATRTMTAEQPRTDEGVVLGSVPYMSPEQAEGRPLDARSDIFSFGAVLYEMITGQRAFRGESRASTLASVVEKEPQAIGEITGGTPPELERLVARCLRKDVGRRSQHIADVRLALEELRDESESGKLVGPTAGVAAAVERRWHWPVLAILCVAVAASAIGWAWLIRRGPPPTQGPELVRLSPDDGHAYGLPAISPDGKFVAYTSDRSGQLQLWLQQVAGGEPIQLTHSSGAAGGAHFLPDGARVVYGVESPDRSATRLEIIPTLGGPPRVLANAKLILAGDLSPDGRQVAYFEVGASVARPRLMVLSLEGGTPRELPSWEQAQPRQDYFTGAAWTGDSRYLLCAGTKRADALGFDEWDWFALPVDGGAPRATGAGEALRAAGLRLTIPALIKGGRVLFAGGKTEHSNLWEIRMDPESWRVRGAPRQVTFGTENELPKSLSASGILALDISKTSTDLYLTPLSPATGQPAGISRRLTRDGRNKVLYGAGGEPGYAYFTVIEKGGGRRSDFKVDLMSGTQVSLLAGLDNATRFVISADGSQLGYNITEGGRYSIRVGDAASGPAAARPLCQGCGRVLRFAPDERFLMYQPEARVQPDPKRKYTVRLLEVATGKDRPWLEHPSESVIFAAPFGSDARWIAVRRQTVESQGTARWFVLPWAEQPVPPSAWIEAKGAPANANLSPFTDFFQYFQNSKLMAIRFDPKTHTFSQPYEIKFPPATGETVHPSDSWLVRGPGLVFSRQELTSSVWLMKLPQ